MRLNKMFPITRMFLVVLAVMAEMHTSSAAEPNVTHMAWWSDARFGMFIHWDMSSIAGTEISWSRKGSKPLDITGDPAGYVGDLAYDHPYEKVNPTNFDATRC